MHENQSPVPLPRYRCHKVVEAAKIRHICPRAGTVFLVLYIGTRITAGGVTVSLVEVDVGQEWIERHKPEPGGYFVRYADGYTSFSPAAAFEEGYAPVGAAATGTLATLAGNLIDDPKVEGAVKDMARWVLGTIEAISPKQLRCDERDSLRHELNCMQIQLRASTRAEIELRQQLTEANGRLRACTGMLPIEVGIIEAAKEVLDRAGAPNVADGKELFTVQRIEALAEQLKHAERQRDELRKECSDLRQALAASPGAFDVLFKADMHEAMGGKRPPMEHAKLIDALARLSCCLPADDADLSDLVSVAKKVAALIQKLRNENAEQSKALFDVSLAVEQIDGGTSGTLQNLAPRIKRLGDRLAHAEREAPPTVAESEGFLAVAHDPGMWSQAADEYFVRKRIYRDHCPTPWVGMLWRHGPGVSNTSGCAVADEIVACEPAPNLGCATTRELLGELSARVEVNGTAGYRTLDGD